MKLKKKRITYYEADTPVRKEYEESTEVIVPDSFPDVADIVGTSGCAYVREKNVQGDRLLVSGVVETVVFYRPEGENGLKMLRIPINFAHVENSENLPEAAEIWVEAQLKSLSAYAPNPRKIAARADLVLVYEVYREKGQELSCGVEASEEEGVEVKTESHIYCAAKLLQGKTISVLDSAELPFETDGESMEICGCEAEIDSLRLVTEKAVVKGTLRVQSIVFSEEGMPESKVLSFPFSQIVEMPEAREEDSLSCRCAVRRVVLEDGEKSENEKTARAEITLLLMLMGSERVETVSDLYSTKWMERVSKARIKLPNAEEGEKVLKTVRETVSGEAAAEKILCADCFLGNLQPTASGGAAGELVLSAVYRDITGGYGRAAKSVPVSFDGKPGFKVWRAGANLISWETDQEGKPELQTRIFCELRRDAAGSFSVLTDSELTDTPAPIPDASYILHYGTQGEDLWQVAREYRSSVASIEAANRFSQEEGNRTGVLIIPVKK